MASNLFRFTIIGEALEASIKEVQEKNGLSNEVCEKIREKFDEVANKVNLSPTRSSAKKTSVMTKPGKLTLPRLPPKSTSSSSTTVGLANLKESGGSS